MASLSLFSIELVSGITFNFEGFLESSRLIQASNSSRKEYTPPLFEKRERNPTIYDDLYGNLINK